MQDKDEHCVVNGEQEAPKDEYAEKEPLILHPVLEVRPDLALVAFRYQVVEGNDVKSNNIIFIATPKGIETISSSTADLPQGKAIINLKGKNLPLASDKVSLTELRHWSQNPTTSDVSQIYNKVETILRRYIYLPQPAYGLVAAWVIGTYFYYAFGAYPFLLFLGLKETGKSNTLFVLSRLCFNAYRTAYLSTPALADSADTLRGTLLLDQATNLNNNQDLLSILTDSYKREGGRRRIVTLTKTGRRVDEFDSYSPKAFASTQSLPEDLADRCFTINMSPAPYGLPDPSASGEDWRGIRTELYKVLLTHYKRVCQLVSQGNQEASRFGELWLPIWVMLTLARVEADEVEKIKAFCAEKFDQVRFELDDWDEALVRAVLESEGDIATSNELLSTLLANISTDEDGARPGTKWLGKALKRLGLIKGKSRRREAGQRGRFYTLDKEQAKRLLAHSEGEKIPCEQTGQTGQQDNRYENPSQVPPNVPSETGQKTQNGTVSQSYAKAECPKCPSVPFPQKTINETHTPQSPTLYLSDGRIANWQWCQTTWEKLGKPVIHAGDKDDIFDLSLYFYPEKLSLERLEGIVTWLENHSREKMPEPDD